MGDALDAGGSARIAPQLRTAALTPPTALLPSPRAVLPRAETMAGLEVKPTSGLKRTK